MNSFICLLYLSLLIISQVELRDAAGARIIMDSSSRVKVSLGMNRGGTGGGGTLGSFVKKISLGNFTVVAGSNIITASAAVGTDPLITGTYLVRNKLLQLLGTTYQIMPHDPCIVSSAAKSYDACVGKYQNGEVQEFRITNLKSGNIWMRFGAFWVENDVTKFVDSDPETTTINLQGIFGGLPEKIYQNMKVSAVRRNATKGTLSFTIIFPSSSGNIVQINMSATDPSGTAVYVENGE